MKRISISRWMTAACPAFGRGAALRHHAIAGAGSRPSAGLLAVLIGGAVFCTSMAVTATWDTADARGGRASVGKAFGGFHGGRGFGRASRGFYGGRHYGGGHHFGGRYYGGRGYGGRYYGGRYYGNRYYGGRYGGGYYGNRYFGGRYYGGRYYGGRYGGRYYGGGRYGGRYYGGHGYGGRYYGGWRYGGRYYGGRGFSGRYYGGWRRMSGFAPRYPARLRPLPNGRSRAQLGAARGFQQHRPDGIRRGLDAGMRRAMRGPRDGRQSRRLSGAETEKRLNAGRQAEDAAGTRARNLQQQADRLTQQFQEAERTNRENFDQGKLGGSGGGSVRYNLDKLQEEAARARQQYEETRRNNRDLLGR